MSNPANPACVDGFLDQGGIYGFAVAGNFMYLAQGNPGLAIASAMPALAPPVIAGQPRDDTEDFGFNAYFEVVAYPCPELYRYQWRFDGAAIPDATNHTLLVLTSPDGIAWTLQDPGLGRNLDDVAFGNGTCVIVGDGSRRSRGSLYTSPDGVRWTGRPHGAGKNLRGVTFANGLFLVTANDGVVTVSTNGLDWAARQAGPRIDGLNLRAATWARGLWVVVGNSGQAFTSTNTIDWTPSPSGVFQNLHGVEYLDGTFVAIGNAGTIIQTDTLHADLLRELEQLLQLATRPQDRKQLGAALEHLGKALATDLWLDDTFLDPKHGGRVFHELKETVKTLEELEKDMKRTVPDGELRSLIARLVATARLPAATELDAASAAGGNAKKLADAREALAHGDADATTGNDDGAIQHYGKAWQDAAHLLRKLLIHTNPGGLALEYAAQPGETYALEASPDLKSWNPVGLAKAGADGVVRFEDRVIGRQAARFYRVRLLP